MESTSNALTEVDAQGAENRADPAALALIKELGPGRLLVLGTVLLALVAFFVFVALRVAAPGQSLLFSGLAPADAQTVVERLESMGVDYRLSDDGSAVFVPEDRVLRLRMSFAESGMPASGTVGYEIFDEMSPLGTTQFQSNVNLLRALEGELARTIASMQSVRTARVHLVMPERALFSRKAREPSASVVLSLASGRDVGSEQVAGIRQLVAGAVEGLEAEQITLVDDRGNLLARAGDGDDALVPSRAEEYRRAYEERLESSLLRLLEHTVGKGNVDVSVTAEMDFDQITTRSETFDPDSQIERSRQIVEEQSNLEETAPDAVTVQNNLPNAEGGGDGEASSTENSMRTEETINYEISRTVRNHVQAGGAVERMSIAVLVDGTETTSAAGETVYEPRTDEELSTLATLVRSAAGIDAERGDVVEVVNRPFVAMETGPQPEPSLMQLARSDWYRIAEIASLAIATLIVVLLVVRPILARLFPKQDQPALETASGLRVTQDGQVLLGTGGEGDERAGVADDGVGESLLDIDQVEGQVRASLLAQATQLIDEHPDEAVRVLRTWLSNAD